MIFAGGISLALFGLASLPTVFERVCSAPVASVAALAKAALELSSCPSARKNVVLFLGASLHYRPILDAFDAQVRVPWLGSPLQYGFEAR